MQVSMGCIGYALQVILECIYCLQVDVVLVSPLTRAVETALLMFPSDPAPTVPIVAVEWCREAHGGHPCDQRRPISVISKEFPQVNFSQVATDDDTWHRKDRRCACF